MNPFEEKNIILGVTGSISAYKAADIASKLTQAGAFVDVILTESARQFVSPLTFQSVTSRKAYIDADLWGGQGHVTHIGLGHAADLVVVAPASANTMAKLAHGIGDNLLTVTALAATCPLVIAPAMDAGMFSHPATQANLEILRQRGAVVIGPGEGHLASGLIGLGRLVEPPDIVAHVRLILARGGSLSGRKVVVTAGGTQEPIDPVRVISNRSSGKQGYAIAQAALDAGAEVVLISAPTALPPLIGAREIHIRSASELLEAVLSEMDGCDVLVMAAAVADFRPAQVAPEKIKKDTGLASIPLEKTTDILLKVASAKAHTGFPRHSVGFAAESRNLLDNAQKKLDAKKLDMIIANDISAADAGFEVETNRVTLIYSSGAQENLPILKKSEVAQVLIDKIAGWF